MSERYDVAVVGAGIIGLAHAYHFAKQGRRVLVIERGHKAVGASFRNFGMIWPIGQPPGEMREMALESREIWSQVLQESGLWHQQSGSLHLAYADDELGVLEEFVAKQPDYCASIVDAEFAKEKSPVVKTDGLKGAMWSPFELCVDPRDVTWNLPAYLEKLGVEFRFGTAVTDVEQLPADRVVLCVGDDFETLFPDLIKKESMTRSKLQMLKARFKQPGTRIGTHLCAGLTLGHYKNFSVCERLRPLVERFERDYPEHMKMGVHLLVSQHEGDALSIGDSHEYGLAPDPVIREEINKLILGYLDLFLPVDQLEVTEHWVGVYPKHPSKSYVVEHVTPTTTLVTGVGGAGMTLSFGLAKRVADALT